MGKVAEKIKADKEETEFIGMKNMKFLSKYFKNHEYNVKKHNFFGMLTPMDRERAREDFINLAERL